MVRMVYFRVAGIMHSSAVVRQEPSLAGSYTTMEVKEHC